MGGDGFLFLKKKGLGVHPMVGLVNLSAPVRLVHKLRVNPNPLSRRTEANGHA